MILLITPPYHCGVLESAGNWPPLSLCCIASEIKKVMPVKIYDAMNLGHVLSQVGRVIKKEKPHYIGIGAYTAQIPSALSVCDVAKKIDKNIVTILGGVHPTFMYKEILEKNNSVDFVVRGEGEITTPELLNAIQSNNDLTQVKGIAYKTNSEIIATPARRFIENLDEIMPAFELLQWDIYKFFVIKNSRLAVVSSSRGCNQGCTFCSQQKFWEKMWRGRTPENFVKEIDLLSGKYKINVFLIADELPTKGRERWEEILDRIIARNFKDTYFLMETRVEDILRDRDILHKYKKAGIIHVYVGIESANQETLNTFKKNIKVEESQEALRLLKRSGIISETSFVLGAPSETKESIQMTLESAKYYNPDFAHFLTLTPWPYADLYRETKEHIKCFDYSKYNLVEGIIKPQKMTLAQINKAIFNCYKEFYMFKLKEMEKEKNPFMKNYFMTAMKLMLENSFLTRRIKDLGKMPEAATKYI